MGLNPMDGAFSSQPEMAAQFSFGYDFAGVIDEAGSGTGGFAIGDRVYGGALAKAAADFVVVKTPADTLWHTPDGISDEVASTLTVAGRTAAATLGRSACGPATPS